MGKEGDRHREAEKERQRRTVPKAYKPTDPWSESGQGTQVPWLFVLVIVAALTGSWYVFDSRPRPAPESPIKTVISEVSGPVGARPIPAEAPRVAQSAVSKRYEQHPQTCRIVQTEPVKTVSKKIFRWKDATGQWHFSDRSSGGKAVSHQSELAVKRQKKFSIVVDGFGAEPPPLLRDKIQSSAGIIYKFLAAPLSQGQLRQADIRIHLIADRNSFIKAYGRLKPGQLAPSGFYTSRTNEAFVLMDADRFQTEVVAVHETAHVVMAALYQKTPLWLNEGVAEYLSLSANARARARQAQWVQALRRDGVMDLEKLFSLSSADWKRLPPSKSYANAWAVSAYLAQTERGREALNLLLAQIAKTPCGNISAFEFFNRWYPGGSVRLHKEVKGWLRTG